MKAIHKKTGSVSDIIEVYGDSIEIFNLSTGNKRLLDYELFKEHFKMVDDDEVGEIPKLSESEDIIAEGIKGYERKNNEVHGSRKTQKKGKPKTKKYGSSSRNKKEVQRDTSKKGKPSKDRKSDGEVLRSTSGPLALKDLTDNPSRARAKLRKAGIEKPYIWSDPKIIEEVKKIIG